MFVIRSKALCCFIGTALCSASPARATGQAPDLLLMNGKQYSILTNPLEPFLALNPKKTPTSDIVSTGLWRGYVATWKIEDDRLILTKIETLRRKPTDDGAFDTEYGDTTQAVFPEDGVVIATWFTGHIVIPTGKLVEYVHMGYASTYKKYLILRVERGVLTKQYRLNSEEFRKFRDAQFAAFSRTKEYQTEFENLNKEGDRADEETRSFLKKFLSEEYLRMIFDDEPSILPASQ